MDQNGFQWVKMGLTGLERVKLVFFWLLRNWVQLGSRGPERVSMGSNRFDWVKPGSIGLP